MANGTSPLSLPGVGPKTTAWLADIGIHDVHALRAIGAVEAYRRLRMASPQRVSLNALWALHAALLGVPWTSIDAATKRQLLDRLNAP
jgi:DNA transformation protein and related proteins